MQKNVLYNILEVLENLVHRKCDFCVLKNVQKIRKKSNREFLEVKSIIKTSQPKLNGIEDFDSTIMYLRIWEFRISEGPLYFFYRS